MKRLALGFVLTLAFALTGSAEPVKPAVETTPPAATPAPALEPGTPEPLFLDSCTQQCYQDLIQCLDDCDAWPYPNCYNDCRAARHACVLACL